MASSYTIQPRQNLFDVALMAAGSVEAVFDIAWQNNLSITDELQADTVIKSNVVPDLKIVTYYRVNNIRPATAIDSIDFANTFAGVGIEFWTIELDFIVN